MQVTKKDLGKNQIELTVEVPLEEFDEHLKKAAIKLSQRSSIAGFRPGKAPYDVIKTKVGEMSIYQEALEDIINHSFFQAITKEKLETIGKPDIKIEKLAPGNPIVYIATVILLPKVTLGNWQEKNIKATEVVVPEEELEKTMGELKKMRAKEALVDRAAQNGDKIMMDFEVSINKAVLEGGTSYKHPLILGEGRMVPGFEEKLIGSKAGDELEFDLMFPDNYHQTNLANKEAHFKIKVLEVFERSLPELTDELAKEFGFDDLVALKKQISDNILSDKENKAKQKTEKEVLDILVSTSTIEEIPEKLIHNEIHKMISELRHDVENQGLEMTKYLESIKKTEDDLHHDFREQAIKRIQATLALKTLAETENIEVSEEEIETEIKKQEIQAQAAGSKIDFKDPHYHSYLHNVLLNQKVIKFITDKIVK
ncbi:trigger factor [Patescibacteria group bacterium]|nr:trigger factor [Patescibacteria group bacterium]